MDAVQHFIHMAYYNRRMNQQIIASCQRLSEQQLKQDKGAFFKSILGTLNHLWVGDRIWLARFSQHSTHYKSLDKVLALPKPKGLDDFVYSSLASFIIHRQSIDSIIIEWLETEVTAEDLALDLSYTDTKGIASSRNFGELISHLFNHQTHHRGQVSTLLNQLGEDIGVTDFLIDIPDVKHT